MGWLLAHPRTTWLLVGLSGALGLVGTAFSAMFLPFLAIGICAPFWLWRRIGGRNAFYALVGLGMPICAALTIAYTQSTGCLKHGGKVELHKNKPSVSCREIKASYLTFAMLFGMVGMLGLSGGRIARNWTAAQAAAQARDDEYETHLATGDATEQV